MTWETWLAENWSDFLQTLGIVGGLFYTAESLRLQAKAQVVQSSFHQTQRHAEILRDLATRPELARIRDPKADLAKKPVTDAEALFVQEMIAHLSSSYFAIRQGVLNKPEALELDIGTFFSLPIPAAVWVRQSSFQDRRFREFVSRAGSLTANSGVPSTNCPGDAQSRERKSRTSAGQSQL